MATSSREDEAFLSHVISSTLLEDSIEWIKSNLNPEEVFDDGQLKIWAEENGFVDKEAAQ